MRFFYPAAALYAALFLPYSVLYLGNPLAHAHEMLFGYALAVVAGNQLGALRARRIVPLFALWLAARALFVAFPFSVGASAANVAFAALFAWLAAPRLLGAAKKLRNQALPLILVGLSAAAAAFHLLEYFASGYPALRPAVLLLALLMLFMGGRILSPAIGGQMHRQGIELAARVQPRIEGALLLAGAIALIALALPDLAIVASLACVLMGLLAAVRLARWRPWRLRGRPDLLCLVAGYAWLALGLGALGAALALGRYESAALHFITVGALGTLTFNVMATTWLLRLRRDPARCPPLVWGTALLAGATLCRVAAAAYGPEWLIAAAACWSAAFVLLLVLFFSRSGAGAGP